MSMHNAKPLKIRRRFKQYTKPGKSMTEQHHARACDINAIMAKYVKTGVLEHVSKYEPTYADVSQLDFKQAMDTVCRVESEFHELPAFVREHYENDPTAYIEAISTPEGLRELKNLKPPGMNYERDGSPSQKAPAEPKKAAEPPTGDSETVT